MQRIAHYHGISLLEILISLFIFSIALLGLQRLQLISLQFAQSNLMQLLAVQQIEGTRDKFLVNSSNNSSKITLSYQILSLPGFIMNIRGSEPYYMELTWNDPSLHGKKSLMMEILQ